MFILVSSRILERNRAEWGLKPAFFYTPSSSLLSLKLNFANTLGPLAVGAGDSTGKPGDVTGQAGVARAGVGVWGSSPLQAGLLTAASWGPGTPHTSWGSPRVRDWCERAQEGRLGLPHWVSHGVQQKCSEKWGT